MSKIKVAIKGGWNLGGGGGRSSGSAFRKGWWLVDTMGGSIEKIITEKLTKSIAKL